MILAGVIEESYDEQMAGYYSSKEYTDNEDQVNAAFNDLLAALPESLHDKLKAVRDAVNKHEADLASNAYVTGVYTGLTDRKGFMKN